MNLARMLSLTSLLVVCLAMGAQQSLEAQAEVQARTEVGAHAQAEGVVEAYEATVGEYQAFRGLFPWLRLYTNPFVDPEEARSADIRCFHRLDQLDPAQRNRAFGELRSGNIHLASRINDTYYVVETIAYPEIQDIFAQSVHDGAIQPELQSIVDGARALQRDPVGGANQYWDTQVLRHAGEFGVVPSGATIFPSGPCERIVNWTGEAAPVWHVKGLKE